MANINRTRQSENQSFKQIEGDSWPSVYLPAICAGVVMTIVLIMAISCSKKDNATAKISAPSGPAVESPTPNTSAAATLPETPKKAVKKHRPANATYVNGTYGVSFSYPRKYSLSATEKQELPVQAGFAKGGAVEIASVDMPDGLYPQTDFSSALLNVSVHQGMIPEACAQFSGSSTQGDAAKAADSSTKAETDPAKPTTVKLGTNEFSEFEQMKGAREHQSDLKYFHLFKNGACYEFALDVETSRKPEEELAQVDRGTVFRQLEKILASARIKEVELPGLEKAVTATAAQPVATAQPMPATQQTEKAQVVTPEQK